MRWVKEYSQILYQIWKKKNRKSFYSWKMDETYIKIKGKWHYLYRAIDGKGMSMTLISGWGNDETLHPLMPSLSVYTSSLANQEWLWRIKHKAPSIGSAFKKLQKEGYYAHTEHRTIKYLNNLIEQDHRPIKRRNKLYQSLRSASTTIKGMETMHALYKKHRTDGNLFGFSPFMEIKNLLGMVA